MANYPVTLEEMISETVALNFGLLLIISAIIYFVLILVVRKSLKSIWYISLGIPGSLALLLAIADIAFVHHSNQSASVEIARFLWFVILYCPGFTVPLGLLVFHTATFSKTELASKSSYLWGMPIAITYFWNWIFFSWLIYA
jgi:hypothetical protein